MGVDAGEPTRRRRSSRRPSFTASRVWSSALADDSVECVVTGDGWDLYAAGMEAGGRVERGWCMGPSCSVCVTHWAGNLSGHKVKVGRCTRITRLCSSRAWRPRRKRHQRSKSSGWTVRLRKWHCESVFCYLPIRCPFPWLQGGCACAPGAFTPQMACPALGPLGIAVARGVTKLEGIVRLIFTETSDSDSQRWPTHRNEFMHLGSSISLNQRH